jgi:hypothetical protein
MLRVVFNLIEAIKKYCLRNIIMSVVSKYGMSGYHHLLKRGGDDGVKPDYARSREV